MSQLTDDLRQMKEILLIRGWCQGKVREGSAVCLVGAMADTAQGDHVRVNNLMRELTTTINPKWRNEGWTIANWNDSHTFDEVIALIDRLILAQGGDPVKENEYAAA